MRCKSGPACVVSRNEQLFGATRKCQVQKVSFTEEAPVGLLLLLEVLFQNGWVKV